MTKLLTDISKAITQLGAGKFKGSALTLLERAKGALERKIAADLHIEMLSAKQAWDAHDRFRIRKRLEIILTEKIIVEDLKPGERLMWCYVTGFYATPESRRGDSNSEATVTIRGADIRISTSEDIDHPSHVHIEFSERYGCYYREIGRHEMFTFPERWLWLDDWQDEFKRRSLQVRLHMARYHRKEAIKNVGDITNDRLPKAESRVLELTAECESLATEMTTFGMEIPEEDPQP